MKIAVISDIHANFEALASCISAIKDLKADKIICLGDLIDYGAQPNECIEIAKKYCDVVVLGNHDEAQFNYNLVNSFGEYAYISSLHTRTIIKNTHIEYLKTLPYTYNFDNMLFVHSSPENPREYDYVLSEYDAFRNFNYFSEKFCFIGHSHYPQVFKLKNNRISFSNKLSYEDGARYIINVGSIGQPRDKNPKLCFCIFDTDTYELKYVRIKYPAEIAAEKIIKSGLPEALGERLLKGI